MFTFCDNIITIFSNKTQIKHFTMIISVGMVIFGQMLGSI